LFANRALVHVDALGMHQRIRVDQLRIQVPLGLAGVLAHPRFRLGLDRAGPVGLEWLGRIGPPAIDTVAEQPALHLLPVHGPCLGAEGVIRRLVPEQVTGVRQLAPVVATGSHDRPDRGHQVDAKGVQIVGHPGRIRKPFRVERLLAPAIAGPRFPVEDHRVEGQVPSPVLPGDRDQHVLALVALLRLQVAERPAGQHRRRAGQVAQLGDDLVELGPDVVVRAPRRRRPQVRPERVVVEGHERSAVEERPVAAVDRMIGTATFMFCWYRYWCWPRRLNIPSSWEPSPYSASPSASNSIFVW
jgi:hypothetical protein